MDRIAVLFPFVGIVVGLGLADLVFSVHRSIRAGRRWHWLPAVWACFTFVFVVLYWWIFTEIGDSPAFTVPLRFAFHLITPVLLVLLCAAALPDGDGDPDLLDYYLSNRRYYFGVFALLCVHSALDFGFNYGTWHHSTPWINLVTAAMMLSLAVAGRLAYHAVMTALLIGLLGFFTVGYALQV